MSYTDMRDFTAELSIHEDITTFAVQKAGGGTPGRAYDGEWWYRITDNRTGEVLFQGKDIYTSLARNHLDIAVMVMDHYHNDTMSWLN